MRRTESLVYLLMLVLLFTACIRNFEPDIKADDVSRYVISGQVAAGDSLQKVNVSLTSPIGKPSFIPVNGCSVSMYDGQGHQFQMSDAGQGDYTIVIDTIYLTTGAAFRVEIMTPAGDVLTSDFDTLTKVPAIDSVYYLRKDIEGNEPGEFTLGIQFSLDLEGDETSSRYYRWDAYETWEYHAVYPLEWWYDGSLHHITPPDYSKNVCWSTKKVPNVFTLSTKTQAENKYEFFPLHYVSNMTSRLAYGYSLLVKQYSITERAFRYWEELRANSNPEGGLYEKQPIAVRGNMHNITHPENIVLGYFGVSSVSSKRIFIKDVPNLPLAYPTYCDAETLLFGLRTLRPSEYPAYVYTNEFHLPTNIVLDKVCVNCTLLGGTIVKPEFWPF